MKDWITPEWPSPANVKAIFTTRNGGVSQDNEGKYAELNLGDHVEDDHALVQQNRQLLRNYLPSDPSWLKQIHGSRFVWVDELRDKNHDLEADAALSRTQGVVCAVLVADCLPILLCNQGGNIVGAIHAGWRGLASGVIENTVYGMNCRTSDLIAWLGPAISNQYFEVGEEVRDIFINQDRRSSLAFLAATENGKWFADIFMLAKQRLVNLGINQIYGGGECTYRNSSRFYSYRRDKRTGRMAALIWLSGLDA